MTLVVEDGTGLDNSNGYISVAYADAYHAARGNTTWGPLDETVKEQAIINGSAYVDDVNYGRWRGIKSTSEQAMAWPRDGARDERGQEYEGVPGELEEATAEYALRASTGELDPDPTYDASGRQVRKKLERVEGAVTEETEYEPGGVTVGTRRYPEADRKLRPLLGAAGSLVERV